MLEKVEETLCLAAWRKAEVDEAGMMVLYMRSKRRVSKISNTISMVAKEVGKSGSLMESPGQEVELQEPLKPDSRSEGP